MAFVPFSIGQVSIEITACGVKINYAAPLLGAIPDRDAELICPVWAGSCGSPVSPIFEPVVLTSRPRGKFG